MSATTVNDEGHTVPAWAERHDCRTRHGAAVTYWTAHRGHRGGYVETATEHDGTATPYPSEARALEVATGSDSPAWCWS